jgi:hypothetical protein
MPARQWGALLDYEFLFLNRVADSQRRALQLGSDTLKRQPEPQFGNEVGQWSRLGADEVRRHVSEMLTRLEQTASDARIAYASEAALADSGGGSAARSFVYPLWEALRQLMRLAIDPNEVDSVVADTERLLKGAS